MEIKKLIGELLKELREDRGWKQIEVARKLGIGRSTLGTYESGRSAPPADILIKLSELYQVNIDYLCRQTKIRLTWEEFDRDLPTDTSLTINNSDLLENMKDLTPHNRAVVMEVIGSLLTMQHDD